MGDFSPTIESIENPSLPLLTLEADRRLLEVLAAVRVADKML